MKHSKEQIIERSKKIMQGIAGEFYSEKSINNAIFEENRKIDFGKLNGKTMPCWAVSINSLFDNLDFLTISDETGEPIYYQNFNTFMFEVEKDDKDNYFMKGI